MESDVFFDFVCRKYVKDNMVYSLVNKDADWIRNNGQKGRHNEGKLVTIDRVQLVFAMRSYWQSELLTVGIKVLETLDALHKSKSNRSAFHQSMSLLHIFEVSKFLLDCQYLNLTNPCTKKLQRFLEISLTYFDLVFPLDWRKAETEDLISLRMTDLSVNLLDEIILQNVYWTIGRLMMVICLDSRNSIARDSRKSVDLYEHIINKLQNPVWKCSVEKLKDVGFNDTSVFVEILNALFHTLSAKWDCVCISPHNCCISPPSFVYLLDRILFMSALCTGGSFYTTKSSFGEWFSHSDSTNTPVKKKNSELIVNFLLHLIRGILYNRFDTESWIQTSQINHSYYQPIFALKLAKIMSFIVLDIEHDYCERRKGVQLNLNVDMVAEAFMSIDDPLLIVSSSRDSGPRILSFSNKNSSNSGHTCSNNVDVCDLPSSSNTLPGDANLNVNLVDGCNLNWKIIKKVSDIINGLKEESLNLSLLSDPDANTIKKELDRNRHILSTTHNHEKSRARKFTIIVRAAFNDMSMLSNAFDESPQNLEHIHFHMIRKGIGSLLSVKPKIDKFLKNSVMSRELKAGKVVVVSQCISSTNTSTTKIEDTTGDGSKGKKNRKSKGKKK